MPPIECTFPGIIVHAFTKWKRHRCLAIPRRCIIMVAGLPGKGPGWMTFLTGRTPARGGGRVYREGVGVVSVKDLTDAEVKQMVLKNDTTISLFIIVPYLSIS